MARTAATLAKSSRIADLISLGVIAKTFPIDKVHAVLATTGRASIRHRDLPAHVMVYYVIALSIYMHASCREVLRCLLEGVRWLLDPDAAIRVTGKSGISQARTRLGSEVMHRLYDEVVRPAAAPAPFRKFASSPWSKTAPMSCSPPRWRAARPARSPWPRRSCRLCARACSPWPIASSSATRCGTW